MAHITRRKRALAHSTLSQGVSLGTALLTGMVASGVHAAGTAGSAEPPATLHEVSVQAPQTSVYKSGWLSSSKFTRPVSKTPQTIQVINQELMADQHATTLTEALRNSAGVGTFYTGENGNTSTGDDIYMRGFDSSSSIFVDGVRDTGDISRDMFNIEQVEVIKGPNGANYGRTAPGGSINLVTKRAHLGNGGAGSLSVGTDNQKRATLDLNRQIGDTTAIRLNLMGEDSDVPGRDEVQDQRWGIAPSISFGLGTDTRLHLNYLHITQNNVPDGGASTIGLPGYSSPDPSQPQFDNAPRPDSDNFYGTDSDYEDVNVDMVTALFEHDLANGATLHNTTRWGRTHQEYMISAFMAYDVSSWNLNDFSNWQMRRLVNTRDQTNSIITNQTGIVQHLDTGAVTHTLSYGLELTREKIESNDIDASASPPINIYHPSHTAAYHAVKTGAGAEGEIKTAAAYLFDTMNFAEHWQVTAGLRLDHYNADYDATGICGTGRRQPDCGSSPLGSAVPTVDASVSDNLFAWQLGVLYQINRYGNVYVDYATSAQPPGGDNLEFSSRASNPNNANFDPRETKTAVVGTKWTLAHNRLLMTAAFYRTEVTNLVETDSAGEPHQTGEKRVQGIELSAVGQITPNWNLSAGFITMDAKVVDGEADANDGSNDLPYTPDYAFTSWSTYRLPMGLTLGGGARYVDDLKRGRDGAKGTPESTDGYWVVDAMASYPVTDNLDLQLNVYNVFDEEYVSSINKSGYRYTPGLSRTAIVSMNMKF